VSARGVGVEGEGEGWWAGRATEFGSGPREMGGLVAGRGSGVGVGVRGEIRLLDFASETASSSDKR
jgi:hypothetical protein